MLAPGRPNTRVCTRVACISFSRALLHFPHPHCLVASPCLHHTPAHRDYTLPLHFLRASGDRQRPAPYRARRDRLCLCLLRIVLAPPPTDMCHVTLAVLLCLKHENTCNTKKNLLVHTSKTYEIFGTNAYNICVKHMWHRDKTLATCMWNGWNISKKRLQHLCEKHMQHPDKTLATYVIRLKNRWYTLNKRVQHTCIAIATCATPRSTFSTSICNTCNVPQKHLKYTLATCASSLLPVVASGWWWRS
jgi:hypothetical protein